eukprot:jgi/Botrbrau1/7356/Bobra.0316s0004.1
MKVGMLDICIEDTAEGVADSPYPLRVVPASPNPKASAVLGEGRRRARPRELASFVVEPRDQFGNRCLAEHIADGLPVDIHLTHSGNECHVSVSLVDGQYMCEYSPDTAGFYVLEVTSQGRPIGGSPFSVQARARQGKSDWRHARKLCWGSPGAGGAGGGGWCFAGMDWETAAPGLLALPNKLTCWECTFDWGHGSPSHVLLVLGLEKAQVGEIYHVTADGPNGADRNVEKGGNCPTNANSEVLPTGQQIGNDDAGACIQMFPPVEDKVGFWARVAASLYAEDGETEGWDSDKEEQKLSSEEKYIKENPSVPVVENLEDLWKVSRLQRERKKKEIEDKARQELLEKVAEEAAVQKLNDGNASLSANQFLPRIQV